MVQPKLIESPPVIEGPFRLGLEGLAGNEAHQPVRALHLDPSHHQIVRQAANPEPGLIDPEDVVPLTGLHVHRSQVQPEVPPRVIPGVGVGIIFRP